MSVLTNRQIKAFLEEFSPSPGYILNLTRAEFEELVDETIDVDIEDMPTSNGKRFKYLLKTCTDEQVEQLVTALRAI